MDHAKIMWSRIAIGALFATLSWTIAPLAQAAPSTIVQVFVVTAGGLGSVTPSAADKVGNDITFSFSPPVCAGSSPGNGQSSYFFGLTSVRPDRNITTTLHDTLGESTMLNARAPKLLTIIWPFPSRLSS